MLHSDNKIGLKMVLNQIFLAKTKCIIIHFESIIMDFIISRKSHDIEFFPLYFCFARRAKFCKNFNFYQVSYAETLQSECTAWPNAFQNLNSSCKKIPLSFPPPTPTFAPWLPFNPPIACPFSPLPPLKPSPPHLNPHTPPPPPEPTPPT